MQITIQPDRNIDGVIMAPPSKSMAHRAVLCAALAEGTSHIRNLEFSKDIAATLTAAGQLCARVTTGGMRCRVLSPSSRGRANSSPLMNWLDTLPASV